MSHKENTSYSLISNFLNSLQKEHLISKWSCSAIRDVEQADGYTLEDVKKAGWIFNFRVHDSKETKAKTEKSYKYRVIFSQGDLAISDNSYTSLSYMGDAVRALLMYGGPFQAEILDKDNNLLRKVSSILEYDEWVYDFGRGLDDNIH